MLHPTDYGPVPVSRIKSEADAIFNALDSGRRVLVARYGQVAAVIDPPAAIPGELLIAYASPGERLLNELNASAINQGSPSAAVKAAVEGSPSYVTKGGHVYGLLRGIAEDEIARQLPTREQIAERERRLEEYLTENPGADAEEVVAFTEDIARKLRITNQAPVPSPEDLLSPQDMAELRDQIGSMAAAYAQDAAALIRHRLAGGTGVGRSLAEAIEARTVEAVARSTGDILSTLTLGTLRARVVAEKTLIAAQQRAKDALASLSELMSSGTESEVHDAPPQASEGSRGRSTRSRSQALR